MSKPSRKKEFIGFSGKKKKILHLYLIHTYCVLTVRKPLYGLPSFKYEVKGEKQEVTKSGTRTARSSLKLLTVKVGVTVFPGEKGGGVLGTHLIA